jgi:prepilin-type N-terminal cleavage/methylation domain-containing protein
MLRNRKGVTLLEVMTVVTMGAIMMVFALPKMQSSRTAASMSSARTQVESYLAVARAIAVRNGGKTQLVRYGNTLMIRADTGTGWVTMGKPVELDATANVTLDATASTISFDSRGLATGLNAAGEKFYFTVASGYGAGAKDSICVTRFGALLDKKCGAAPPPPSEEILILPDISLPPPPTSPDVVSPY